MIHLNPPWPCEKIIDIVIPILQMRNQKYREAM